MLKIYGIPRSRAFRTLWMAKELGLDYENVATDMGKGETRTPEFLAINPNGHIPAIDDDGFVLWESIAINLYLAKKHASGSLYPVQDTVTSENLIFQLNKTNDGVVELGVKESNSIMQYITLKAYKFPFINLLWAGVIIMVAGIIISIVRRIQLNRSEREIENLTL